MSMIQCHKQGATLLARFYDCVQTDLALTQLDKETFEKDWKLTREIALAQKRLSIIVRWHVHRSSPRRGRKKLVVRKIRSQPPPPDAATTARFSRTVRELFATMLNEGDKKFKKAHATSSLKSQPRLDVDRWRLGTLGSTTTSNNPLF